MYICTTCGEDFTRRYNAIRHSRNIHGNTAEIVRFVGSIAGKASGKYLEPHPWVYGSKKWNDKNNIHTVIHESNENNSNRKIHDAKPPITSLSAKLRTLGKIF